MAVPAPLTTARVVAVHVHQQAAFLLHALNSISGYVGMPPKWSLQTAAYAGDVRLLQRLRLIE